MAKLDLRKLVFTALLLFATTLSAFGIQETAANANSAITLPPIVPITIPAAPPTVTSISPNAGPPAGGTAVTLTGTGFTGATAVTIGGFAATAVNVVSDTQITATTPVGTAGPASVLVTTPKGLNAANTLFSYAKGTQALSFTTAAPTSPLVGGTYTPVATGGASTSPVLISTSGACSIAGGVVSFTAVGTCTVYANQAGDANYDSAIQVQQSFVVGAALLPQTITFTSGAPTSAFANTKFTPQVTGGGSGQPIVLSSATPATCTVSGSDVTLVSAGTCTINANQAGNVSYAAAAQVQQTFDFNFGPTGLQISQQPAAVTVAAGATASFAATLFDVQTISWQWQVSTDSGTNWNEVAGASGTGQQPTLSFVTVAAQNGYLYRVAASDPQGTQYTNSAKLTVTGPPLVTTNPASISVISSQTATFTAAASGTPTPTVQWQRSTNGGATFSTIAGATNSSYIIQAVALAQSTYQFKAVFTNVNGSVTTSAATLTVTSMPPVFTTPAVTTNPTSVTVISGQTATFTAAASGLPPPSLQWQQSTSGGASFSNIAGATTNTYSFTTTASQNGYQYQAVFNNGIGTVTTSAATLTVTGTQISQTITFAKPADVSFTPGGTVTLSATGGASGNPVTFASTTPSVCTTGGTNGATVSVVTTGQCGIIASQLGNTNYPAAANISQSFVIAKAAQAVTYTSAAPASIYKDTTTYTPTFTKGASSTAVVLSIDGSSTGSCTIGAGNVVSFGNAGTCVLNANQAGDSNYTAAAQVQQVVTIAKAASVISFTSTAPTSAKVGDTYQPQTTSTGKSGAAVSLAVGLPSVCAVDILSKVTFTAPGQCTITATQAGGANYLDAVPVSQVIVVIALPQVIGFTSTPAINFGDSAYSVAATGGASGKAITFTVFDAGTAGCSVLPTGKIGYQTAGSCTIAANQKGNAIFADAAQVTQVLTVSKAAQTIALAPTAAIIFGLPYSVTATGGGSTNPVTFTIRAADQGNCSIANGNQVLHQTAGACVIFADQAGNGNYLAAPQASQTLTINQAAQTLSFTSTAPTAATFGGATYSPAASSTAPLAVGVSVDGASSSICTLSGGVVSFTGAGTCTLNANQSGNLNYLAAKQVQQSFTVSKASQTISFTKPADATYAPGLTVSLPVTNGASGNPVTYASNSTGVCTVSASTVSVLTAGNCSVTASLAGNGSYLAASPVTQSFAIGKAAQTVTLNSTLPKLVVAGGSAVSLSFAGGGSTQPVVLSLDATTTPGTCAVSGYAVTLLKAGTCTLDANQAGDTNFAAATTLQVSLTVQDSTAPTVNAIGSFVALRGNMILTSLFSMDRTIDRLNDAQRHQGGAGSTGGNAGHFNNDTPLAMASPFHAGGSQTGTVIPTLVAPAAGSVGMADYYGLQQMIYSAMQQMGQQQGVNAMTYSGPFDAQAGTSGGLTGSFHSSMSQFSKWQDNLNHQQAAAMGLATSQPGEASFMPLDVWVQGTFGQVGGTQTGTFGQLATGVDYTLNANLLIGFFAQGDLTNLTSGQQANGTGWLAGPYATVRLTDHLLLEARGAYGRSSNSMVEPLTSATDQFGASRWLASSSLVGRWQIGQGVTFKPNATLSYYSETTDAFVNSLNVAIPSVSTALSQVQLSPEVDYGFTTIEGTSVDFSLAPALIWNSATTSATGLGSLDPTATGPTGLRGVIKAGAAFRNAQGLSLRLTGSYDGIGFSGYSAISGQATVKVPLN